eukprot:GDKH01024510.1.p4 GENE.GDKH01024510.1~~GDKH01024510.1.p4  ORF type:complete len:62 (+),score=2.01 GDKH01024510.1:382-567(+)
MCATRGDLFYAAAKFAKRHTHLFHRRRSSTPQISTRLYFLLDFNQIRHCHTNNNNTRKRTK